MWDKKFLDSTLTQWLTALGILVASVIISKIVQYVLKRVMNKIASKTSTKLDDIILGLVGRPLGFLIVLLGLRLALQALTLPMKLIAWVDKGFFITLSIVIAWLICRLIDALFKQYIRPLTEKSESTLDDQLLPIFRKALKWAVWIVAMVLALDNAGYDIGAILAGLGLGGLAFAMAAKDTVSNLFGSFTIFTDKPFAVGDRIVIDGNDGTVKEIGMRSTRLVTLDNRMVTIPNSHFQSGVVENISSEPSRKVPLTLGLTYDMDHAKIQQAMDILKEINAADEGTEEECYVGFTEFGDFSLNVLFIYFIKKGADILDVMTSMHLEILRRFNESGLEMAFPTQTVYHQPLK